MTIQTLKNFTRLNKILVTSNKTPIYTFYLIPTLKIEQDCSVYGAKSRVVEFWFLFWCIRFKK